MPPSLSVFVWQEMLAASEGLRAPSGELVKLRIGLHCGPAYAGVVGIENPRCGGAQKEVWVWAYAPPLYSHGGHFPCPPTLSPPALCPLPPPL